MTLSAKVFAPLMRRVFMWQIRNWTNSPAFIDKINREYGDKFNKPEDTEHGEQTGN